MNDYNPILLEVFKTSRHMHAAHRDEDYDNASALALQLSQLYRQLELLKTENAEGVKV